jgi:hypothetical protein
MLSHGGGRDKSSRFERPPSPQRVRPGNRVGSSILSLDSGWEVREGACRSDSGVKKKAAEVVASQVAIKNGDGRCDASSAGEGDTSAG